MKSSSGRKIGICWCLLGILVTLVQGALIEPSREKIYVPASCVHVAPNLPECRNVRFLNAQFDPTSFNLFGNELFAVSSVKAPQAAQINQRIGSENNSVEQTPTWGQYLGFYRPTVTVTSIRIYPSTVVDSRVMVSYDIRGCKPHSLPFDLPKCIEDTVEENIATTPVTTQITASKLIETGRGFVAEELEGSETVLEAQELQTTTQKLQ